MRLAILFGFLALAGCDSPKPPSPATGSAKTFAVSFQTMNNPFFVELNDGLKTTIEAKGDKLVTLDARYDSLKQKNDLSDAMLQDPAAIFINPVNWEGIRGPLLEAQRRKIPVIIVDAPVSEPDLVVCQVASDNVEAGRLAADALAKANPKAKVVILQLSINKACIDRVQGFREAAAKHPGLAIVDAQEGKGTSEGARPVMVDLLGRFPDIDACFPINDPSALGAISAIESATPPRKVTVVTVDGSKEGIAAIRAGKLLASSAQFPKQIGRVAAEKAYEHLSGKMVEKDIKIPVKLVTIENADSFESGR
jgi:ribose transport system substrate-binding protein